MRRGGKNEDEGEVGRAADRAQNVRAGTHYFDDAVVAWFGSGGRLGAALVPSDRPLSWTRLDRQKWRGARSGEELAEGHSLQTPAYSSRVQE